ncbi:MAG TPA: branched-chain amino acid ABC transporter permease [Desulfosarcina sp.]|nr:branched-chain amino acid ABC transporter permease [Desulfosarcina sp.]
MPYLPCGVYHETYSQDHALWQTNFVRGKMALLALLAFVVIPFWLTDYLSEFILFMYWAMGGLGVQLLIGFCGQLTLGHAAFLAVGAYSSFLLMAAPWPQFLHDIGLAFPMVLVVSGVIAGIWCVIFGLPSARVKGFYLILTTMAAQFITVDFFIAKYISQIGGRQQDLTLSADLVKIGPWTIDTKLDTYYFGVLLLALMTLAVANLLRSKLGRAWVAIRDNDIAAESMGINIIAYTLLAFIASGVIGGLTGAFWGASRNIISVEDFLFGKSLWLVGIILIGGVGTLHGVFYGSLFMVFMLWGLQEIVGMIGGTGNIIYFKEIAFGLAICGFLLFEPNGLAYRWWQSKNYFNLWPFSY